MKLGKEAKAKIPKENVWLVEALLECTSDLKVHLGRYAGIFFNGETWLSTDCFRVMILDKKVLPIEVPMGKFIPRPFADSLACEPIPDDTFFPDFSPVVPNPKHAKHKFKFKIPGLVSAADLKKKSAQITINLENESWIPYLGNIPQGRLSEDHLHFNLCYLSHLGSQEVVAHYYGPKSPVLMLPQDSGAWRSVVMPTITCEELILP